jgi:hypothetical protein
MSFIAGIVYRTIVYIVMLSEVNQRRQQRWCESQWEVGILLGEQE